LLDLLLSYKQDMSQAVADGSVPVFRRLEELFILPVYPQLPSGGRLDLLNAGQREGEEQLSRYALNLRTFDWQDFYFNWAGELFFDWLHKTLVPERYDVVLVDSRTGVTEMGGICAYQLADVVVMFCATNRQNLQGTRNVIENFFSARVQALRHNRPLQVLAAPARVEQQDASMLESFRNRFESAFEPYLPASLKSAGMTFWDLVIPYDPRYSFEEQVVARLSSAEERHQVASAYEMLVEAMILVAEPDSSLGRTRPKEAFEIKHEALYDITQQTAGYDVFLSYALQDRETVQRLAAGLREAGLTTFDARELGTGEEWTAALEKALGQCRTIAVIVGRAGATSRWQEKELAAAISKASGSHQGFRIVVVLLPGADAGKLSGQIAEYQYLDFRAGLNNEQALRALLNSLKDRPAQAEFENVAPYLGLQAFNEQDVALFFGRESDIAELLQLISRANFLVVTGASGSGKSSLVMAGLIPRLRGGALPGSQGWRVSRLRPGDQPLRALAIEASLLSPSKHVADIEGALASSPRLLPLLADEAGLRGSGSRWLLVIDQFEEIWTQTASLNDREVFLNVLVQTAAAPDSAVILMIILRADFLDRALSNPGLARLIRENHYLLGIMGRQELRAAIEYPARRVGLAFEPGLVEQLLNDVAEEPGSLPLLQFVLSILWERRRSGFLTLEAYAEVGGARGAMAYGAEAAFGILTNAEQAIARGVLLRLVQPGEGLEDTRRRASMDDLAPEGSESQVYQVIQKLTDARILVISVTAAGASCELAHEALIRGWPRLRAWIDESRQALRVQRQLSDSAREWAHWGRDPGLLYRGVRLESARDRLHYYPSPLSSLELEFLEQSEALAKRERSRRLRWMTISASVAAVVSFTLGILVCRLRL
jgi:hypothetical protein